MIFLGNIYARTLINSVSDLLHFDVDSDPAE